MMWFGVLCIFLCLNVVNISSSPMNPVVQTKVGAIRGLHATDGDYTMFKGIPYAAIDPNNPFAPSLPRPPFATTYDAFDDSAKCPQIGDEGTLDCLRLSIYVPSSASPKNPLPVMLLIHGGAFQIGSFSSSIHGPKYLMKHDVILVSISYRLSLYGFMCLDIPEVPGNAGLKDQARAIKWVKENIAAFGGDDNNITLIGGSAGAASVDFHLRYNKEQLFHKVIMESGTAAACWAIQRPDHKLAIKLANKLGYETLDSLEAVKFLAQQSTSTVFSAFLDLGIETWPCVEQEFLGVDRFVTDYAMNLKIPKAKSVPIMIGHTNDERLYKYVNKTPDFFAKLNVFRNYLLEAFDLNDKELQEAEQVIKRFYLGDDPISQDKYRELGNFDTDFYFVHPIETAVDQFLENGATAIYQYLFSYVGRRNHLKHKINTTLGGAFHGDESGYLFNNAKLQEPINDRDQLMIDRLTTMWTNFAKFGNPTPTQTTLLPVKWKTVSKTSRLCLDLNDELSLKARPYHDRQAFLDLIYLRYQNKQWGYKH